MRYDLMLSRTQTHGAFDAATEPVCRIESGQTLRVQMERADQMMLSRENPTFRDRVQVMEGTPNPVTGPIHVRGAQPGDKLRVSILELDVCPDGSAAYTTHVPGPSALMPPFSLHQELGASTLWCEIRDDQLAFPLKHREALLPLEPFIGTIGTAPARERRLSYWNGQEFGGNMDCPSLRAGREVVLPVNVEGGLLSLGDVHARQGDGEVTCCAVECRADATIRVDLIKAQEAHYIDWPQVNGPDFIGSVGCTMSSMERSIQAALYDLFKRLEHFHGFDPLEAYMFGAQCVKLEICQFIYPHYTCLAKIDRQYL